MDILTKPERSRRMSLIRSKWTKQEQWMHGYLKGNKIRHEMHPKISGSPDVTIRSKKVAIFLNGCFWHGCPECYKEPSSNKDFWKNKVENNRKRDRKNKSVLRSDGWKVVSIWEHQIARHNPSSSMRKIISKLQEV